MSKKFEYKKELFKVIFTGYAFDGVKEEEAIDSTINILSLAAKESPSLLLGLIRDAVEMKADGMVMLSLAVLSAKAGSSFLNSRSNCSTIISILDIYEPTDLLEYVEYLKSKTFGKGFGSKSQKWVRKVMERWNYELLIENLEKFENETISLIRLVHPRYKNKLGELVKSSLKKSLN